MINEIMADTVKYLHLLLILFVLTGYSYTPIHLMKYYLLFIIIIFLDWNDWDGQCTLTGLEYYLRQGVWIAKPAEEAGAPEFFRPWVNKIFNTNLNRNEASRLNNFLFMVSFLIGFLRMVWFG